MPYWHENYHTGMPARNFVSCFSGKSYIYMVATRCHILKLKCTEFDFGWGSAPDPARGAYGVPPDSLPGFKGFTSKGREGEGKGEEKGEKNHTGTFALHFELCQ